MFTNASIPTRAKPGPPLTRVAPGWIPKPQLNRKRGNALGPNSISGAGTNASRHDRIPSHPALAAPAPTWVGARSCPGN